LSQGEINTLQTPGEIQENYERYVREDDPINFHFDSMSKKEKKKVLSSMSKKIDKALELIERGDDINESLVNALSTQDEMKEFVRKFIKE